MKKYTERQKTKAVESPLEEQFATGRLLGMYRPLQGSHKLWKSWRTWKITKISSMHEKILEFEKKKVKMIMENSWNFVK